MRITREIIVCVVVFLVIVFACGLPLVYLEKDELPTTTCIILVGKCSPEHIATATERARIIDTVVSTYEAANK